MKLLPCPFCGGEPEEDGGMFFEFYGHERQDYSIACKKCRAEVRCDVGEHEGADAPCSCHHDTRKICAEKWNRRAAMLQGAEQSPVTDNTAQQFEALATSAPSTPTFTAEELKSFGREMWFDGWRTSPHTPNPNYDCNQAFIGTDVAERLTTSAGSGKQ